MNRAPLIVAIVLLLLVTACAPKSTIPTGDKGEHLTLAEAKGRIQLELPEVASDIRFYQRLTPDRVIVADFAVPEDAFLEWAAQQGWKPKPIVGGITIWPRSPFGDKTTEVDITDGYSDSNERRGVTNGFSITFDRKSGRAYYSFDSEPSAGER